MSAALQSGTTANRVQIRPQNSAQDAAAYNSVLAKLLLFTALMVICPLGTYYCSIDRFFGGSATYAAASAAGMANVILAAFVVTAIMEDSKENKAKQKDQ